MTQNSFVIVGDAHALLPPRSRWLVRPALSLLALRAWLRSPRPAGALALVAASAPTLTSPPSAAPSPDPAYVGIGAALAVGALLTTRGVAGGTVGSFLSIPCLVAYARFGVSALPALVFATLLANAVHGVRPRTLLVLAVIDLVAFADADLVAHTVAPAPLLAPLAFLVGFTVLRYGLRELCVRSGLALTVGRRAEQSGILLPIALSPLAALPLMAGAWLGDGSMLLMLATVLALLVLVREAANLASARAEAESERDRLARANAFQDELVHLITHELKTPLTSVRVYTQLGQRALKTRATDTLADCFGGIAHAERSLERLIDNLLQIGTLEQSDALPQAEKIDLSLLAQEVIDGLSTASKNKQQSLTLDTSADLPCIWAPPLLLREALSNLVSNAIKYTPEGGRVLVSVSWNDTRDAVRLSVADSGFGLSEADLARLFTKFFRSSDARVLRERGTGLGLALTQAIVQRMGGQLTVTSQLNQGSTFQILLPAATRAAKRNALAQATHPSASARAI